MKTEGCTDASTNQGMLRISGKHQKLQEARQDSLLQPSGGAGPRQYFDLGLSAPGTVRQLLSVFLSHPVRGPLLQSP